MTVLKLMEMYCILMLSALLSTSVHSQTQQECTPVAGQNLTFTRNLSSGGSSQISFSYTDAMKAYSSQALDCVWRVSAPPGMFLKLSFDGLVVIHQTYNCMFDYLKVREGTNETGHQYGNLCGWTKPDPIYSVGQDLFIRFHSSPKHLQMNAGFTITLTTQKIVSSCSTLNSDAANMNIHVNGSSGVITSPGYGITNYPPNMKCVWRISAQQGYIIKLRIVNIDIEGNSIGACNDELDIYDGLYATENLKLGRFCGTRVPPDSEYSSANQLMVYFKSDYSVSRKGFKVEFHSLKTDSTGSCTTRKSSRLGGMGGTFMTPNYPLPYPKHAVCTWTITAPTGYHLKLTISHFAVKHYVSSCTSGYFKLVAANNATVNTTLGKFCGSASYPKVIFIRGNILWTEFLSSVVMNDVSTGVRASYEAVKETDSATICSPFNNATTNDNLTLTDLPGTLISPNYPATYPRSMQCTWTVSAPTGKRIRLTINDMYMGPSPACKGGYLQVGDGDSAAQKEKICNIGFGGRDVYSNGRHMWLRFRSDSGAAYRGFSLDYKVTNLCDSSNSYTANNDIRMTSSKGNFTSPGYPGFYPTNIQCTWKITVPHGKRVRLRFTHFGIEDSGYHCVAGDYVLVRNGLNSSSGSVLGKYCGYSSPGNIYSTGNQMWVRLKSDSSSTGSGFKAEFDAVNEVNVGAIAGGVVAGAIVFIVIIGITVYCIRKKRQPTATQRSTSPRPAARPIYPPQGRTYIDEPPAPIMHGVYPPYQGRVCQNPGYPQQQPSPYQQRAGPYPTHPGPYPTQAGPYPTQAAPYPTQAAAYQTQAAPYPGPPPAYDQAPPKEAAPQQALVPPTERQQNPSTLPVATPDIPTTSRAPLLNNEEVPL